MRILTGDRPTGPLHLGHYVGSLQNRINLSEGTEQFIIIANLQALTTHWKNFSLVEKNIFEVVCDYLAIGVDTNQTTIFVQSTIPQLAELTIFFMNLVTVNRLKRNPTVKNEMKGYGFEEHIPVGFFTYPISQAADILLFHPTHIPVGNDQLPMIEQTNEIAASFNHCYQKNIFSPVEAVLSLTQRLPGIDGKEKMSKSKGNAIMLSDSFDTIKKKVHLMYTDPDHISIDKPGRVEGNVVFTFLDIFHKNKDEIEELKKNYRNGGLGDSTIKKILVDDIENFIAPIREKRIHFSNSPDLINKIIKNGNERAYAIAEKNIKEIKKIMHLL